MSNAALPAWAYRLIDGLMAYDSEHPELFARFYPTYDYQRADCPCHLLKLVPDDIKRDTRLFMAGIEAAAMVIPATKAEEFRCPAHGLTRAEHVGAIANDCTAPPGEGNCCETYAVDGLHWDTCPQRGRFRKPLLLDVSRDPQQRPRDDDGRYIEPTGEDR